MAAYTTTRAFPHPPAPSNANNRFRYTDSHVQSSLIASSLVANSHIAGDAVACRAIVCCFARRSGTRHAISQQLELGIGRTR